MRHNKIMAINWKGRKTWPSAGLPRNRSSKMPDPAKEGCQKMPDLKMAKCTPNFCLQSNFIAFLLTNIFPICCKVSSRNTFIPFQEMQRYKKTEIKWAKDREACQRAPQAKFFFPGDKVQKFLFTSKFNFAPKCQKYASYARFYSGILIFGVRCQMPENRAARF